MKKFMIVYISPTSAEEQMQNASPEDMKKGMEPWMNWFQKCGEAIVDAGTPLVKGISFTKDGSLKTQLGIAGYSIVQAEDMEAVKAMIADHPHFMMEGNSIDVFEMMPMPM